MPAPGDQYNSGNVKNPFEERVVNGFTAKEIATLQSRLNQQLGPEYISQRPGNGGGKVAYLEGNKAIALANEVFGFNGWSSSLGQVQIDYVDENTKNGKVCLGLSIVVRITLKDGTYHEDIGYGSIENGKGKAASFEKAKKEAATDGLKRALRTFGNVLGNCLYDKTYLKKVQAMKHEPIKIQEDNLFRHPGFAPRIKEEVAMVKREPNQTPVRANPILRTRTDHLGATMSGEFDDEFDGNLFDGVDIPENPDEDIGIDGSGEEVPYNRPLHTTHAEAPSGNTQFQNGGPLRPFNPKAQNPPASRGPTGAPNAPPQNQQQNGAGRPPTVAPNARGPQTSVQQQGNNRPELNKPRMQPSTVDIHAVPRPQRTHQNNQTPLPPPQNQPLRPTLPQAQQGLQPPKPAVQTPTVNPPPNHMPPVGFVTSRAAELMQASEPSASLTNIPAFNPHAESPIPKEQRTPGLDHARSVPIKRGEVSNAAPPAPPNLAPAGAAFNRPGAGPRNSNYVNPNLDANRRIGMPGGPGGMSPAGNRSAYKPPMKRPPLQDVSNQGGGANGNVSNEPDAKRQKVEGAGSGSGPGMENVSSS